MEKKSNALLWSVFAIAALVLILNIFVMANMPAPVDEDKIANLAANKVLANMPEQASAEEIAALVLIPEVEVPDSNAQLNNIWDKYFSVEVNELKDEAEAHAMIELEDDDYEALEDFLKSIVGFDELNDVDVKDVEFNVINLGLEDDEDKEIDVFFKMRVEYELDEGAIEEYKDYVYAHYNVFYDEGDFSDEDVSLIDFSFEELEVFA